MLTSILRMLISQDVTSPAPAPSLSWQSLVERSIASWEDLRYLEVDGVLARPKRRLEMEFLRSCTGLNDFLDRAPKDLMFYFFQRKEAFLKQETTKKWSQENLDDYVLLPATPQSINRNDCFFMSHFWLTKEHPDPDGAFLRQFQHELAPQKWSYIWVDWTCAPQSPRNHLQEKYFKRTLATVSGIIRNCGFVWFYPPFEARLWILYEIAEYTLTCSDGFTGTPDIQPFLEHVQEMIDDGIPKVLDRYDYKCEFKRDKLFLISWLELLIILRRRNIDIDVSRRLMDSVTWRPTCTQLMFGSPNDILELDTSAGILTANGTKSTFTPFPT